MGASSTDDEKASRKIWVMRRMKKLGLDGKKTISGFLKAEGQFFDIFFYLSKTAQ